MKRAIACGALLVSVAASCDDESSSQTAVTSSANVGGNGSGASGSGASGGSGVGGGGGGSGCLDPSEHAAIFSVDDPGLCVVAHYTAPVRVGLDPNTFQSVIPSWGRHDGPLVTQQTFDNGAPINEITLSRFSVPSGASGALGGPMVEGPLAPATTEPNPFMNPWAIDLPFASWTVVGWALFGGTDGEAIMITGGAVAEHFSVVGLYSIAGVQKGNDGRIVHASLTGLEDAMGTQLVGVYATDICDTAPCGASIALHVEGDASGPVALDQDGNLFALFPDLAIGDQGLRAWNAASIAPMAAANAGTELARPAGSGTALAALAPKGADAGYLLFQPFDGSSFTLGNVMMQRYTADMTSVAADGELDTALTLATAGAEVTLMGAPNDTVWVGVVTAESPVESTFFVLARTP